MTKRKAMDLQNDFVVACSNVISAVITFFMLFLTVVFPLIYDDSYFNILEAKYRCYLVCVIGMFAMVLVSALVMLIIDFNEFKGVHAAKFFSALKLKNWRTTFTVADIAVLVFWLICLISTLQSEYLYEAFWGNEGRYSGLFLITIYVAFYLVVSRFWKVKGWILEAFLISGMIVCFIGITDYFQMDILRFRVRIKPEQSTLFTSTIGNINTYTAYVALLMGLAASMFATSKSVIKSVWYYVCMVVTFFAIIMGCSDNAYLALGGMFAFLPFILFRNKNGTVRYVVILATFTTVIQCIDVINRMFAGTVIGLDSLFQYLANFKGLPLVVAALWAIAAALYAFWFRKGIEIKADFGKRLVYGWGVFVLAILLIVCFMLLDANALGNGERYGSLGNYLVFSDSWGTNRGYIWRKSVELYRGFSVIHKIFGFGPDTFGILTTELFKFEMIGATGQVFDNAHNEYLQFLITIGPVGLAAYLLFLIDSCRAMVRGMMKNPYMVGCATAVLCYGFQALVNLNLPIATPMMWLLLSVGIAAGRDQKRQ